MKSVLDFKDIDRELKVVLSNGRYLYAEATEGETSVGHIRTKWFEAVLPEGDTNDISVPISLDNVKVAWLEQYVCVVPVDDGYFTFTNNASNVGDNNKMIGMLSEKDGQTNIYFQFSDNDDLDGAKVLFKVNYILKD